MGCVKSKPIYDGQNKVNSVKDDSSTIVVGCDKDEFSTTDIDRTHNTNYGSDESATSEAIRTSSRTTLSDLMTSIHKMPSYELGNNCVDIVTANAAHISDVYEGVEDGPILGYGISGMVRKVKHRETGAEFACKPLPLDKIETKEGLDQLKEELGILMQLDHPNIVKLEGVYETEDQIFLIQELLNGGDLFDHLDAQPEEHYSEAQCARVMKQMLSAVRYIHSKGIIHRDLKLENFLFNDKSPNSELKMIDFGLSKHFRKDGTKHHEPVGTRYTVAPEVILGNYDEKVDVWAIGVITFLLLSGEAPFGGCYEGESPLDIKSKILNADYSFEPAEYWNHVSSEGKSFIRHILVPNPFKRPDAASCQTHPWLQEFNSHNQKPISMNVQRAMTKFRGFSDMRKLLCEVIGFTLMPDQIMELRKEFEKLDVHQTGEISLDGLKQVLCKKSNEYRYTEEECEEIFDSMRLHGQTTIHWHHFLAAGLSECHIDDRNHRLAFDKIDTEKKGYITFDDIVDVTGALALDRRVHSLQQEFRANIDIDMDVDEKVYFEDFVKIMKNVEN